MSNVIFSTIHGSRLYGLAHIDSDMDVFTVTDSKKTKVQHMVSENGLGMVVDDVEVGLKTFLKRVMEGSHQSLEALFSERKHWMMDEYRPMLENIRVGGHEVFSKYERTIKKFCFGDFKRRRHACRLALNLNDLRSTGRFDPTLGPTAALLCGEYASRYEGLELFELIVDPSPDVWYQGQYVVD